MPNAVVADQSTGTPEVVISLTAVPPRFDHLEPTLRDLLAQTAKISEIRLNIPYHYRRFPEWDGALPKVPRGIRICRVEEDFGPATKILPAASDLMGQNVEILFCDDDHHYDPDWAERFIIARREHPNACVAAYGYDLDKRRFGPRYNVAHHQLPRVKQRVKNLRYRLKRLASGFTWKGQLVASSGFADIFEGVAGAMIRPNFLPPEVFKIPDVLWTVDDPWLSGHLTRNGVPIWIAAGGRIWPHNDGRHLVAPLYSMVYEGFNRQDADSLCIEYFRKHYGIWEGPCEVGGDNFGTVPEVP